MRTNDDEQTQNEQQGDVATNDPMALATQTHAEVMVISDILASVQRNVQYLADHFKITLPE